MQPTKRITDRTFRYTSAEKTNLHQTFAKIRFQMLLEQRQREAATTSTPPIRVIK